MSTIEALAASTLDTLPMNVAILDEAGDIVFTNRAWQEFGTEGEATPPGAGKVAGTNYFEASRTDGDPYAARAVAGIQDVIAGEREVFELEYPCHSPERKRWFLMRAAPFSVGGRRRVLVAHVNVTDRKMAELDAKRSAAELRAERRSLAHLLDRVNGLVADVARVLVEARSRAELERRVCETFAGTEPYVGAWIGRPGVGGETLRLSAAAGICAGDQDADGTEDERAGPGGAEVDADGGTAGVGVEGPGGAPDLALALDAGADHPTVRAATERERQVVADAGHLPEAARERDPFLSGAAAAVALPLVYRDTLYGVLTLYADRPDAVDDREGAVLDALARTLANAVNAVESKKMLSTDAVVEVEVTTDDEDLFFVDLARRLDCGLEYHGSIYRDDGVPLVFFAVEGGVEGVDLAAHPAVADATVIAEGDDETLVEFAVPDAVVATLADYGGVTRQVTVDDGLARLRMELPDDASARSAVETLASRHGADLVAYRERQRPAETREEFRTALAAEFTDRQLTALKKAYYSGYFEWPRPVSGDDLAESMDVARSTFHQHLRAAERKLLQSFFDQ